jgi:hypothetical protein
MLALSTAPWRVSFRLTVQQAVDDGPGLLVISGFLDTYPVAATLSVNSNWAVRLRAFGFGSIVDCENSVHGLAAEKVRRVTQWLVANGS